MWEVKDDVIIETTWAGNKIYQAKIGLLKDKYWRHISKDYPLDLLCAIRKGFKKSTPLLTEKFNPSTPSLRYFGYRIKKNKSLTETSKGAYSEDKAYIYVQPEKLVIDLKIEPNFANEIRRTGFEVNLKNNFQGNANWLTGWYVPHSTTKVDYVVNWLFKVFEENL